MFLYVMRLYVGSLGLGSECLLKDFREGWLIVSTWFQA